MEVIKESNKSVTFGWDEKDFDALLRVCLKDEGLKVSLEYLQNKESLILEAGCGLGRVVKYLHDLEFKNVHGIEINKDSVEFINKNFPELNVVHGDILNMPYKKNSFDFVLSYGVVEHFIAGPDLPMKSIFNVLKPGGIAVITVPSFNLLRRLKYRFQFLDLRKNSLIRRILGKNKINKNGKKNSYYVEPQYGKFFEYRFTPKQFKYICKDAGFKIIKNLPIAHIDGLYHELGKTFVTFNNWEFKISKLGRFINFLFKKISFFHNHMHLCVLKKEI